jgi:hypothetical protein
MSVSDYTPARRSWRDGDGEWLNVPGGGGGADVVVVVISNVGDCDKATGEGGCECNWGMGKLSQSWNCERERETTL